jgi:hypothetical protein
MSMASKGLAVGLTLFALAGGRALASDATADRTELQRALRGDSSVQASNAAGTASVLAMKAPCGESCKKGCCAHK